MSALLLLLRLGLGALFVIAGALKIGDPTQLAVEVTNYRFLPSLAPAIAVVLPTVEMVLGAALIALPAAWRRGAALALALLLAAFTVAVTQAVARGINVSCGCFGGSAGPVTIYTVARDLLLLGAAVALVVLSPSGPPLARRR